MSSPTYSLVAQALSRITSQHRGKPFFEAMVRAMVEAFDDIEAAAQLVDKLDYPWSFRTDGSYLVEGVCLDYVGALVGQPRRVEEAIAIQFFGWDDDAEALGWGSESDPTVGGTLYSESGPTAGDALVSDDVYRILINARIAKNHATGNVEDMYEALSTILAVDPVDVDLVVYNVGGMAVEASINRDLTDLEIAILRNSYLLPLPAGVRMAGLTYWEGTVFGWDDDPTAAGFDSETSPTGVVFAEEIAL